MKKISKWLNENGAIIKHKTEDCIVGSIAGNNFIINSYTNTRGRSNVVAGYLISIGEKRNVSSEI